MKKKFTRPEERLTRMPKPSNRNGHQPTAVRRDTRYHGRLLDTTAKV